MRDLADALARIYAGTAVALSLDCPSDPAVALSLDCPSDPAVAREAQDVDEIFGNLLDNAFKYTTDRVRCTVRDVGRQIVVEIADNGPGLDSSEATQVLHPGQRLDEEVPGYAFSLPIARELAELYGGSLELAGGDRGLVVTVRLPAAR